VSKALSVKAAVSSRQQFFDFLYKWGMLLTVVALVVIFGLASDNFLDPFNIINILRSIAIVTVIGVGVSISLTIGGFDLSVGSTASLANALVISLFVWHGFGTTEAILVTLALCTLVGLFNAFLIVVLRIPDMLATLGSLFVIQGVAMTYSYGGSITENMVLPSGDMAEGDPGGVWFAGPGADHRHHHAGGDHCGAAWPVADHPRAPYVRHWRQPGSGAFIRYSHHPLQSGGLCDCLTAGGLRRYFAGFAHWFFAGERRRRLPDGCGGGGVDWFSLAGSGKPNALGTLVGAVILGVLSNGLVMLSVPYYAMDIIKGLVLAGALALTYFQRR
jgi:simple sugar transport system permease protein